MDKPHLTDWCLSAGDEHEVRDNRNQRIANIQCGGMTGRRFNEATDIARLIASAPDLLSLVEGIEQSLTSDGTYRLLREACRAAILKARGEGE